MKKTAHAPGDRAVTATACVSAATFMAAAAQAHHSTWVTLLSPALQGRFYPQNMNVTEAGATAIERFEAETMHPGIDCVPFTSPIMMFVPDIKRITLRGKIVLIAGEFDGAERTVDLSTDKHDGASRSVQGHSIGWREGETLVIETTRFADHANGNGFFVPSGPQKHLLERLTLNGDRTRLTYQFELTDLEFLAEPMTGEAVWVHRPDLEVAPEACDLDNARRLIEN